MTHIPTWMGPLEITCKRTNPGLFITAEMRKRMICCFDYRKDNGKIYSLGVANDIKTRGIYIIRSHLKARIERIERIHEVMKITPGKHF